VLNKPRRRGFIGTSIGWPIMALSPDGQHSRKNAIPQDVVVE
jgi:hypothetical protein